MPRLIFALTVVVFATASACLADDAIRVTGTVTIQESKKSYSGSAIRELFGEDGEVTIDCDPSHAWFRQTSAPLDDIGSYGFFGQRQQGKDGEITVKLDARISKYVSISPVAVNVHGNMARSKILLRSPENASAAIFDQCNAAIETAGGLQALGSKKAADAEIINCLNNAQSYFDKPEISRTIGDILDRQGEFDNCVNTFDLLSLYYKEHNQRGRYERTILRAALCREKRALLTHSALEWAHVSKFSRDALAEKIADSDVRLKMLRIWYDSFLSKIRNDGDLSAIAQQIADDERLREEWVELYYINYFWGQRDRLPRVHDEKAILTELKKLSDQYSRSY